MDGHCCARVGFEKERRRKPAIIVHFPCIIPISRHIENANNLVLATAVIILMLHAQNDQQVVVVFAVRWLE
jgi:hypothetical protein